MWSKFDDQFYMNPKIARLDRDEQDIYIAAIIYCNGQLTDGFIPANVLPMLAAWAKIEANAKAIASRLVDVGLWELSEGGYTIHDFLDWNLSRAEVLALKEARSNAGKRGGEKSGRVRRQNKANAEALALANAQAKQKQKRTQSQSLNPVPEENNNGTGKKTVKESSATRPPDASLYPLAEALAKVCGMDLELNRGRIFKEAKVISAKADAEYILSTYDKGKAWYSRDWRGKKGELPTFATIRQTIGSLNGTPVVDGQFTETY